MELVKVNVDTLPDLALQYQVTFVPLPLPTYVVLSLYR